MLTAEGLKSKVWQHALETMLEDKASLGYIPRLQLDIKSSWVVVAHSFSVSTEAEAGGSLSTRLGCSMA